MSDPTKKTEATTKTADSKTTGVSQDQAPAADPKEKAATIEQLAQDLNAPTWAAAALKARHGWPIGKKLLPSEYKAKLDALISGHTDGDL